MKALVMERTEWCGFPMISQHLRDCIHRLECFPSSVRLGPTAAVMANAFEIYHPARQAFASPTHVGMGDDMCGLCAPWWLDCTHRQVYQL